MSKTLTLTYLENGKVYNDNQVYNFDNENLATTITITVPEDYEDFSFVVDCQNGTITKQYSLGSGDTTYSFTLDDSISISGTLELQLWATILSNGETVKVQWQKYSVTIDDALNISEITAEDNPDIIATHTSQLAYLMGIITDDGDGTLFLSDDGTYKAGGSGGTTDYTQLTNKPSINSITLSGNKTSADLGLTSAGTCVLKTGDTMSGDLNFIGFGINQADYVDLNINATPIAKDGRIHWNALEDSLTVDSTSGNTTVSQVLGQTLWFRVRNDTGSPIPIGKAVYSTGATGNTPTVALARADSLATSLTYLGVTVSEIPNNGTGYVVRNGYVTGINTNAWNAGQILYLSSTNAGEFVTTRPTAPNIHLIIGSVRVKSGSGSIAIIGDIFPPYRALSDVYIPTGFPNNNDIMKYNLSNLRWEQYSTDNYKTYAGFVNRTDSTISIDSGTGVFTLAPAVMSYTVYVANNKLTINTSKTVTVTDDQTITYIYLDNTGALQKSTSSWDLSSGTTIPVAIVFKDATTYSLTDERHGYERNRAWHNWAHNNIGAMYKSGLTGTFTTSTLSIAQGIIYDEDIAFDSGGTKTTTSLWYRNATNGMRLVRGATACKSVSGGGILQYDNGSGTLQEVTVSRYTTNWVYASNDATEPIYTVIGQNNSATLNDARNTPAPTINLSTAEWKLIYKVIYQRTAGTPAGAYVEATDYRAVQTGVPTASVITDHATLINRDATNSHPATAISYSTTNVGDELDARINKTYTLTIDVVEWSTNSYAQVITGLTNDDLVLIQAPDSYYTTYGLSYTQSGDTITFTVTSTPLVSLSLGIAVTKAVSGGAL